MTRGATTNLCLQSENIATSPWSFSAASASVYSGPLPSGVSAMLTLTDDGTNAQHWVIQTISSLVAGKRYILSVYARSMAGSGWMALKTALTPRASFNLLTGATGTVSPTGDLIANPATNIELVDSVNSIYRVSLAFTASAASQTVSAHLETANDTVLYQTPQQQVALGGWMLEEVTWGQTTPSPYVATTSTTADGYREYRQNLQTNSNSFNSNLKNLIAATFVTNAVSAPVLSTLADKLQEDSSNGVHGANINICGPKANLNYTVFFFAKAVGSRQLRVYPNRGDGGAATFNLLTGTSTSSGVGMLGAGIQAMPSQAGWYMCWYSYKESYGTGSNGYNQQVLADATNTISYQGDGSSGVYLFGAQVVDGVCNGPIDYIATIAAQANASGAPRSFGQ